MMKLGCPVWQNRISPVLDTAEHFLVVEESDDGSWKREEIDLSGASFSGRIKRILDAGIEVLICGAVSREMARFLEAAGIHLIPWVSGEVDQVLDAFLSGVPELDVFSMPGWRGRCRRWRYRRGLRMRRKVMRR